MSSKYIINVRTEFSAAHALRGYIGDCARLHGHNWKVKAKIQTTTLNELGIGVDFKQLKQVLNNILATVEHQYLNEIPPFDVLNPTAENISAWIFQTLRPQIDTKNVQLLSITLWETERSSVEYSE